jgi:branched-chain amino acid transport system ATP-binding protein
MAFLEVKDLEVFYGKACALSGISFSVEGGQCVGIIGPNGAGKSTLLDSIMGLTNWRGEIIFDGVNLRGLTPSQIVKLKIGYSPERGGLFRFMNVKENLLVGAYCARGEINENLRTVFKLFPVLQQRLKQEAGTLSGGERQMLSLGKALMTSPKLLLLDEPTLGLAPVVVAGIFQAIDNLRKMGVTIVVAEQNASFTLSFSDKIYLLERGRLLVGGTPEELKGDDYVRKTYFGL